MNAEQDWGALLDRDGRPGDDADAAYDREYADGDGGSKSVVFKSGQGSTTGLSEFCSMTSLRLSEIGDGAGGDSDHVPAYGEGHEINDVNTGKALYVCLKLDPNDFSRYDRAEFGLCREASLLLGLPAHGNIVCLRYVYADREASGSSVGRFLVFTDAVSGSRELSTAVDDGSLLDGEPAERRVLQVGHQLAVAVHHVNAHGILHQDVKPDNCLIFFDGDDGVTVKLLDFGMATRGNGAGAELRCRLSGFSPGYESPDIVRLLGSLKRERSEATFKEKLAASSLSVAQHDLWSYAITLLKLWEAFAGVSPATTRSNASGSRARARLDALPEAAVPAEVRKLLRTCLDADADLRPPSLETPRDVCEALLPARLRRPRAEEPGGGDDLRAAAHNNLAVHMTALATKGIAHDVMLHEADKLYAQAIALEPAVSLFHANRAFLSCQLNRPEAAIASCEEALRLEGETPVYMTNLGTALLLRTEAFNPPSRVYERVLQRRAEAAEAARLEAKVRRFNFGAKAHPKSSDNQLKEKRTPKKSIIGGEALLDAALEDDYAKEHRDTTPGAARTRPATSAPRARVILEDPERSVGSRAAFLGVSVNKELGDQRQQTLTHIARRVSKVYRLRAAHALAKGDLLRALKHTATAAAKYGAPRTSASKPAKVAPLEKDK
ncbi:serine/threonine kinase [Aureococcus anophagefferens]|nr:serine/threonine kinase [Aureococcus anophagefferens]